MKLKAIILTANRIFTRLEMNLRSKPQIIARILAAAVFFMSAVNLFAQKAQTTDNKADGNLKSLARVNPSTLAMEFSIPLGSYPGRGGNSIPFSINYSSKLWKMKWSNFNYTSGQTFSGNVPYYYNATTDIIAEYGDKSMAGWTSSLMPPIIIQDEELYNQFGETFQFTVPQHTAAHLKSGSQYGNTESNCWWSDAQIQYDSGCMGLAYVSSYNCCPPHEFCIQVDTDVQCFSDPPGGPPVPNSTPPPPEPSPTPIITVPTPTPQIMHTVKRVRVQMPDGSSHEFRKDDKAHNCQTSQMDCFSSVGFGSYLSVDGSGMRLEKREAQPDMNNQERDVLYMPNGSKYVFANTGINLPAEKYVDVNGNTSTYNSTTRTWTDTLGREIKNDFPDFSTFQVPPLDAPQSIKLKGINNQDIEYKAEWKKLDAVLENSNTPLRYPGDNMCSDDIVGTSVTPALFVSEPVQNYVDTQNGPMTDVTIRQRLCNKYGAISSSDLFNPIVLGAVELPNGAKYQFKYNEYGEITRIIYPTGGYERFVYGFVEPLGVNADMVYKQGNRGVHKRFVSFDGTTETQEWNYSSNGVTTTIIAPDNSKSERDLHYSHQSFFGFEDPRAGMPSEERGYDTSGTLRSRTLTDYAVTGQQGVGAHPNAKRDARSVRQVSIILEGEQALATITKTEYDDDGSSDPSYFSHLNVKESKSYHYVSIPKSVAIDPNLSWTTLDTYLASAVPAAVSQTDYMYNANYRARGIIGLATEIRALNPANPSDILAKSQTVYDEQSQYYSLDNSYSTTIGYQAPTGTNAHLRGNATTSRTWVKETNTWLETHAQFDNFGNLRRAWDVSGDQNRFVETQYGANNHYAYPTKVITPAPDPTDTTGTNETSTVETTYDFTTGLPLTVKDDFGQITKTDYDSMLRPWKTYGVNYATPESQMIYGVPNQTTGQYLTTERFVEARKQIDANNWDEATTWFDGLGRIVKTQSKDSQGDVFVKTQYDQMGRVDSVSNPYRQGETIYWSKSRYDELGRVVESYAPAQNGQTGASLGMTSYSTSTVPNFIGNVMTTTDAAGRKGRSITNALGQLLRVDEPQNTGGTDDADLGTLASPLQPTFYKYDERGNLKEVNQSGQTRTFTYDTFSRIKSATNPESGTVNYTYDIFGNLKTKRDARGIKTIYDYDKANRIINRCYRVIGAGALGATSCDDAGSETVEPNTPDVNYFYDGRGLTHPQTPNYAKGKLTKVSSSASETLYTSFDDHGRILTHQQITNGQTYSTSYKYDLKGELIEQTYPSGKIVRNFYDADGDLSQVVKNGKNYASDFSYTAAGAIDKMRLGNGNWESAIYSERLQPIQVGLGNSQNNTTNLWKVNYEYGELNSDGMTVNAAKNNGNIAKQIITVPTVGANPGFVATQTYIYDPINRLKQAKETVPNQTGWQQTFSYDRFGNRNFIESATDTFAKLCSENASPALCETDRKSLNPSINHTNNRLTVEQSYEYDANGNLTKNAEDERFTYDALNKQTEVKNSNSQSLGKYIYDGEGKRIKKLGNMENTLFVYDAFGSLIAEYAVDNPLPNPSPQTSYLTTDTLGSPRVVTGKSGEVLSRRDFLPFGEEIIANENNRKSALGYTYGSGSTRQSFTGYEKDAETDLVFAQNRYYSNRLGRFTTPDPLMASGKVWNPQSWNRYAYVNNNPLNATDPLGLDPEKKPWWYLPCSTCSPMYGTGYTEESQLIDPKNFVYHNAAVDAKNVWVLSIVGGVGTAMAIPIGAAGLEGAMAAGAALLAAAGPAVGVVAFAGVTTALSAYLSAAVPQAPPMGCHRVPMCSGTSLGERLLGPTQDQMAEKDVGPVDHMSNAPSVPNTAAPNPDDGQDPNKPTQPANPKSTKIFGHTFNRHGAGNRNTQNLLGRARGTGENQGQWLNNQQAADFLSQFRGNGAGPFTVKIPNGMGQIIKPNGSIVPASRAVIVPNANGFRTAYPVP